MRVFCSSLLVLAFSIPCLAEVPETADVFCEKLKNLDSTKDPFLSDFSAVLGTQVNAKTSAKDTAAKLAALGFDDIFGGNPHMLDYLDKLPKGSILILEKGKNKKCPLKNELKEFGHVGVACGNDQLVWGKPKIWNLTDFSQANGRCISAIMFTKKWHKAQAPAPKQ